MTPPMPELEFDTWGCGDTHARLFVPPPPCENCGGRGVVTIFQIACPECSPVVTEDG